MSHPLELVVLGGLPDTPPWPLGATAFTVGRLSGCDWVLRHPSISRQHARFSPTPAGWQVEDLGSSNGTWLGGERLSRPALLRPGQAVRLGDVVLLLRHAPRGEGGAPPGLKLVSRGQEYHLVGGELLLGRSHRCHLTLDDVSVSRLHARIVWESGVPYLSDAGSRNGTQLNGRAVTGPTPLAVGDRFTCGEVEVVVDALLPAPVLWLNNLNLGTPADPCLADGLRLDPGDLVAVGSGPHLERLRLWLAGLGMPTGGSLLLAGEPVPPAAQAVRRQRRIGYIPAQPGLLPALAVEAHVALPGAVLGQPREAATALLRRTGLADLRRMPVEQLGAEDRMRLAAALALAGGPALLVVEAAAAEPLAEILQGAADQGAAVLILGNFRAGWLRQHWAVRDGRLVALYVA
jgi:pSer/pThr/pTyr-binding forkhead associated (FHA) protein/predicted ABC-type transport system involved in lysophospholipase L1 biosynthesis ATPase subunit